MIGVSRTRLTRAAAVSLAALAWLAGCTTHTNSSPVPDVSPQPGSAYFVAERGLNQVVEVSAQGSTLATLQTGKAPTAFASIIPSSTLWVVNAGSNSVSEIDESAATLKRSVAVGNDPEFIQSDWTSTLYVGNAGSQTISVVDVASASVTHTVTLPGVPVGMGLARDAHILFVGIQGGLVDLIDTASLKILGHVNVAGTLAGVFGYDDPLAAPGTAELDIVTSDGKVEALVGSGTNYQPYAAYSVGAGTLTLSQHDGQMVFNQTTGSASLLSVQGTAPLFTASTGTGARAFSLDGNRLAVAQSANDTIGFYDATTGAKTGSAITLTPGAHPYDVWVASSRSIPTAAPTSAPTSTPTTTPTAAPTASPTATPVANVNDTVYVADYTGSGLDVFTPPLSMNQTPSTVLAQNSPYGIAVHGNTLAVTSINGLIETYTLPLSNGSTPSVTTGSDYIGGAAFDPSGNLWVASDSNNVYEFAPPFGSGMTPAKTAGGFGTSNFLTFDSSGTMYVTVGGGYSAIVTMPAPYSSIGTMLTAPSGSSFQGICAYNGKLAVADAGTGSVLVYNLPLTSSSTPAFTLATGSDPVGISFDSVGNLFVATVGNGSVSEYAAPLSATSQKIAVLVPQTMSPVSSGPAGVAVSP